MHTRVAAAILGSLVVNEVFYDPPGADGGREFVEILNVSDTSHPLVGLELQVGDGARGTWRSAWRGSTGELQPGAFLLVAGDSLAARHFTLHASLQNGPDAVRLLNAGVTLDVVGYGALTAPDMYEGRPAQDVTAASLARHPDGHDSDDNADDFVRAVPTPGRANVRRRAWRLALEAPDPTRSWPGRRLNARARVSNVGIEALEAGAWRLRARLARLVGEPYLDGVVREAPRPVEVGAPSRHMAPGDSVDIDLGWDAMLGLYELSVAASGADGDTSEAAGSLYVRVGAGAVLVNEIFFAPATGDPEWVELVNRDSRAHDVDGWTLADATGRRAVLHTAAPLAPQALALASSDSTESLSPAPHPCLRISVSPWPSLNNTDGDDGWADQLVLRDAAGIVQDALFYRAAWGGARGRSIERLTHDPDARGLLWSVSKDPAGATPGRTNSATAPATALVDLLLQPNPFSPNGDGDSDLLGIAFQVPPGFIGFRFSLFDTSGRRRRSLAGDRLGPGPRRLAWDGTDDKGRELETGIYIVHLELIGDRGRVRADKRAVGLVRP